MFLFQISCRSISYLSGLLDKDDRSIRIAAGEALALIFETGSLEKFSAEAKKGSQEGYAHVQGLKAKVIHQVRNLSIEAGGKGSAKKDLNNQRNLFKDILEFIEVSYFLLLFFQLRLRFHFSNVEFDWFVLLSAPI